ncbi:MAG: hypothetical protein ACO3QC_12455, partial [Phycisphaerales bacterium]
IDDPNILLHYAESRGLGPQDGLADWYFLTGEFSELEQLRRALGLYDLDPSGTTVRLSGTISALNSYLEAGRLTYSGEGEPLTATLTRGASGNITSASPKTSVSS